MNNMKRTIVTYTAKVDIVVFDDNETYEEQMRDAVMNLDEIEGWIVESIREGNYELTKVEIKEDNV